MTNILRKFIILEAPEEEEREGWRGK